MAPITIIPKACSCCKGERSSRDKSSNFPLPNILYEGSKGGGGGFAASFIKKRGRGSAAGCVEGLWKKVLKMDGPSAQRFLSLTGPSAPRVAVLPLCGNAYKVSVTGFTFSIIWYEKQFCGLAHCVRLPLSGCAGLPPVQGEEQPVLKVESLIKR